MLEYGWQLLLGAGMGWEKISELGRWELEAGEAGGRAKGHLTQPAEWLQDIPLQGHLKLGQDAGQLVLNGTAHLQGLPVDTSPSGSRLPQPLTQSGNNRWGILPPHHLLPLVSPLHLRWANTLPGLAALTDLDTIPSPDPLSSLVTLLLWLPSLPWTPSQPKSLLGISR